MPGRVQLDLGLDEELDASDDNVSPVVDREASTPALADKEPSSPISPVRPPPGPKLRVMLMRVYLLSN